MDGPWRNVIGWKSRGQLGSELLAAARAMMTPTHQHQHQPPDLSRPRPGVAIAASFTFLTLSDPNSVSGVHDETQVASVEIYSSDEEKIFTNLLQNI